MNVYNPAIKQEIGRDYRAQVKALKLTAAQFCETARAADAKFGKEPLTQAEWDCFSLANQQAERGKGPLSV